MYLIAASTSSAVGLDPLLVLGLILLAGIAGGSVARRLHLPGITGNIFAGVLIGPSCLALLDAEVAIDQVQPLSTFALGLIAMEIGGHLSYRRLHNALRRIIWIAVLEVAGAVAAVLVVARILDLNWPAALLLSVISATAAPATTVAVVRECRAKGSFVKTMLAVVALDNVLCIILFGVIHSGVNSFYAEGGDGGVDLSALFVRPMLLMLGSVTIGLLLGVLTEVLVRRPKYHNFSTVFICVLMGTGLSALLGFNALLTCLAFGLYLGNCSSAGEEQLRSLQPIEPLLYVCFFTLAGVSLHLHSLLEVGWLCLAMLVARFAGKGLGVVLGGMLSRCSSRITLNMAPALLPQAGLAIGLLVILEGDHVIPADLVTKPIEALILATVTINEIIGPVFTRRALRRANEDGKDRPRLIEFLQEEFILTDLKADSKEEAIRTLAGFLVRAHRVDGVDAEALYQTFIERENSMSTAIGKGVAIPHGRIADGPAILGVLGICPEGVPFDAPDGEPVTIIMLIATPKDHETQHLRVMAALASMVQDDIVRTRLVAARDANHALEIVEGGDTRDFNYFLEGGA